MDFRSWHKWVSNGKKIKFFLECRRSSAGFADGLGVARDLCIPCLSGFTCLVCFLFIPSIILLHTIIMLISNGRLTGFYVSLH